MNLWRVCQQTQRTSAVPEGRRKAAQGVYPRLLSANPLGLATVTEILPPVWRLGFANGLDLQTIPRMNFNTFSIRLFCVLFLTTVLVGSIFTAGTKAVAPLAVCLLPSTHVVAHYTSGGKVVIQSNSQGMNPLYWSDVTYDGHDGVVISATPCSPLNEPKVKTLDDIRGELLFGRRPPEEEHQAAFPVCYATWLPGFVVRDLPESSIGTYYADMWRGGDVVQAMFVLLMFCGVAFGLSLSSFTRR